LNELQNIGIDKTAINDVILRIIRLFEEGIDMAYEYHNNYIDHNAAMVEWSRNISALGSMINTDNIKTDKITLKVFKNNNSSKQNIYIKNT